MERHIEAMNYRTFPSFSHAGISYAGILYAGIALAVVFLCTRPIAADDWPHWLGPTRDGVSRETGWLKTWPEEGPRRLWSLPIGGGYSSVVIEKQHLILFHRKEDKISIDSLHPASGKLQWSHSYSTSYVDRYGYDSGPRCAPTIYENKVYTLDPEGLLLCLDLDGKKLWERNLRTAKKIDQLFFGTGATPLIREGKIYAHIGGTDIEPGSGYTFALDTKTGKVLWETPNDGGSYASPILETIDGVKHLFVFHRGGVSCYDPMSGRERWKYRWHSRIYDSVNAATPLVSGNLLFFSATYGTGAVCLRVEKDSYTEVWKDDLASRDKIMAIHWAPPMLIDGHVYGFSGRHSKGCALHCVELGTGKVKWKWPSFLTRGSMMYSDGHAIALGEYGDLALLEISPKEPKVVARLQRVLRYPAWTVPTLVNGRLYLRDLHQLICFEMKPDRKQVESKPTKAKPTKAKPTKG